MSALFLPSPVIESVNASKGPDTHSNFGTVTHNNFGTTALN